MSSHQIESSLEAKLVDQPVASYREDLMVGTDSASVAGAVYLEDVGKASSILEQNGVAVANIQQKDLIGEAAGAIESESPFRDDAVKRFEIDNKRADNSESDLALEASKSASTMVVSENSLSGSFEQESDVAIISDSSEFLDLNLGDAKPEQEMVLVEGDQLIVDDVNESLITYKSDISEEASVDDSAVTIASSKPSVFAVPAIDENLMSGDSEISKQYRKIMSKLISINAKLRTADEENVQLRRQFEMSVLNNQQLAQIIRDIDDQIKAFTLTN
jgi:hypothetical protein